MECLEHHSCRDFYFLYFQHLPSGPQTDTGSCEFAKKIFIIGLKVK
jgi:hypothetical protein